MLSDSVFTSLASAVGCWIKIAPIHTYCLGLGCDIWIRNIQWQSIFFCMCGGEVAAEFIDDSPFQG